MQNALLQNPKLQFLLSYTNDKKVTKNVIVNTNLIEYINHIIDCNFRITSKLLLRIVKIYIKKIKYLLDDTNELYNRFRLQKSHKKLLQPTNKVEIDFSGVYLPEEDIYHNVIDSFVESMNDNIISDMNFSMSRVEVGRDEGFKRRKIDNVIELDSSMFKWKINKNDKESNPINTLPEFIMDIIKGYRQPVEVARADSMVGHFEPDHSTFEMQSVYECNSMYSSEIEMEFDEEEFCFNEFVSDKSRYGKAKAFLNVLGMCNNGKMRCEQNEAYGKIVCYKME